MHLDLDEVHERLDTMACGGLALILHGPQGLGSILVF
jgi:hypothetical protein